MASFINTNMASLNTQRNLSASQAALHTSIQRLSSGMRVNSAKDDAAGMAIASRMDSQIRGQTVAMRNANDAISFSQTAEGALSKIGDNLQRMRELAVQAANGTNGSDDRVSLNTEFAQLQSEIQRVTSNTQFNGVNVLNGGAQTFQVGSGTSSDNQITIQGLDLTSKASATQIAAGNANPETKASVALATKTFLALGATVDTTTGAGTLGGTATQADLDAFTAATAETGARALAAAASAFKAAGGTIAADGSLASSASPTTAENNAKSAFTTAGAPTQSNILDQASATDALTKIDAALKEVNTESIKHGANQNRFTAVIATLQVSSENQTAARSRIMDTDFASETATMARGQILQQAGMAMLAQANQLPNGVMALLR